MKTIDWVGFVITLIICNCFFRFAIEQTIQKSFKKIENKLDNLECDIANCREEVRNLKKEFESIQEELNLINEKLVVGKKNEKICQLVDEKKELKEEIERLNKVNQQLVRDYWDRLNNISYYPLVTPKPWWGH